MVAADINLRLQVGPDPPAELLPVLAPAASPANSNHAEVDTDSDAGMPSLVPVEYVMSDGEIAHAMFYSTYLRWWLSGRE
ncbi:hypothetical protein PLEOSDRAFT_161896 [Pleurotus ostreatus PC15]|uniref:Uncharacterized protein n=1 Tax=Pleurotus ostreatus (strain PC15) TaxID=1137138 RepID=A0A067NKK2_PLEO1|nr:hypothetical protein PLEOSDRAFT_161896 [Pleurotus ostreatus PC15]